MEWENPSSFDHGTKINHLMPNVSSILVENFLKIHTFNQTYFFP